MLVRLGAAIVGAALGVVTLVVVGRAPGFSEVPATGEGVVLLALAGWLPMAASLVVPRSQRAPAILLYLAGATWFTAQWGSPRTSVAVFVIGLVTFAAPPAFATHAASTFGGASTPSRALAAAGYVVTVGVLGFGTTLWFRPDPATCGCAGNPFALGDDPALTAMVTIAGLWMGLGWAVWAVLLFTGRLFTSTRARLRSTGVTTACGAASAALAAVRFGDGVRSPTVGTGSTVLWVGQGIVLIVFSVGVVAEVLRVRRARRALTRIVTDGVSDLRSDLAARLGDSELAIAYTVDGGERHVDLEGRPVTTSAGDSAVTPVRRGGAEVAVILHRTGLDAERIGALVSAVDVALEHERLIAEARARVADLRASGERIVIAGDAERARLERDLHDGAQQRLVSLLLHVNLLRARHPEDPALAEAGRALAAAADELRGIARRVSPVLLASSGLGPALAALAETRALTVTALPDSALPALWERTIYLTAERATRAGAASLAVTGDEDGVTIEVRGAGDLGLEDIADRVTTLGGEIVAGEGMLRICLARR